MASISGFASIAQKLSLLQPKLINPTKCDPNKSLYGQIIRNNQATLKRQAKQFNLGNTLKFTDPIKAAQFLLQREYGTSSLFKNDLHISCLHTSYVRFRPIHKEIIGSYPRLRSRERYGATLGEFERTFIRTLVNKGIRKVYTDTKWR